VHGPERPDAGCGADFLTRFAKSRRQDRFFRLDFSTDDLPAIRGFPWVVQEQDSLLRIDNKDEYGSGGRGEGPYALTVPNNGLMVQRNLPRSPATGRLNFFLGADWVVSLSPLLVLRMVFARRWKADRGVDRRGRGNWLSS